MSFINNLPLSKAIIADLENFKTNQENFLWNGQDDPLPSLSENVMFYTEEIYAMYDAQKIMNGKLIWTTERTLLYGTEVRKTVVADTISREYETIRGLSRSDKLEAPKILGWSIQHTDITCIEIIKLGERYSIYFFENDIRRFVVNDLLQSQMEIVSNFLKNRNVKTIYDQFNLPLRDIFLFFCGGLFIFAAGLILIALIF
ncbi:hypothetical protein [Candidatus Hodarchaeum mangrovi]